jgi:hypothetical protein
VKNYATDVQVGSTAVVTGEDVAASPSFSVAQGFPSTIPLGYLVEVPLVGVSLTASTKYYVEVTTAQPLPSAAGDEFWAVDGPMSDSPDLNGEATFANDANTAVFTDSATVTSDLTQSDASLTLSTTPTAPTGLTATQETEANDPDLEAAGCTIPTVENVALDWTPTALGADFGYYQIERDDDDTGYQCIAEGTDEDSETYTDWESIRGEPAVYRMRAIRGGDWIPSAYTSTATATADPYGAEVVFASNWLQAAIAVNHEPEQTWPQPTNDGVLQLAGRDYQFFFQEAENRGDGGADGFTIPVVVYSGFPGQNNPTPDGRAAFGPLIDYLRDYAPYIAILLSDGSRWYGRARVDEASISYSQDAAGQYTADVQVWVTQAEPTPAEIPSAGS